MPWLVDLFHLLLSAYFCLGVGKSLSPDDRDRTCFPQDSDVIVCCHPNLHLTNGVAGFESSNNATGNPDCWNHLRSYRRCCDPILGLTGEDFPMGPPIGKLGGELTRVSQGRGTWLGKNASSLPDFINTRVAYVTDDLVFQTFRSNVDRGHGTGCDGFYDRLDDDILQMMAQMNVSDWGKALLNAVLPRVAPKVDAVGRPFLFRAGVWGLVSSDVFNMLYKLMLMLESFGDFMTADSHLGVPTVQNVWDGPEAARLFAEWDIIEVGAGPGIHAATLVEAMGARTYSIVDLPTQQALQYKVLSRTLGTGVTDRTFAFVPCCSIPIPALYTLPTYDLFISTYALSELSETVRAVYFYTFIVHSKRGFVIDNHEDIHNTRMDRYWEGSDKPDVGGGADRGSHFTGLDLVWRLQDYGYDVNIVPKSRVLKLKAHRSRTVVITWAATEVSEETVTNNLAREELRASTQSVGSI